MRRTKRFILRYEVIIYWSEEDRLFVAEVPELAGCMADGKTPTGALQAAEPVAKEWIETAKKLGREVPKPRGRLMYA